ncbi:FAD-dependent oxidoreductase [Puniceibacterium antarcticum]|nr:FAD-dependent oxidoreductase [Puniceibacterium antarcticum]
MTTSEMLRAYLPGCANWHLSQTGPQIGVRGSRHRVCATK